LLLLEISIAAELIKVTCLFRVDEEVPRLPANPKVGMVVHVSRALRIVVHSNKSCETLYPQDLSPSKRGAMTFYPLIPGFAQFCTIRKF